ALRRGVRHWASLLGGRVHSLRTRFQRGRAERRAASKQLILPEPRRKKAPSGAFLRQSRNVCKFRLTPLVALAEKAKEIRGGCGGEFIECNSPFLRNRRGDMFHVRR